MSPLLFLPFLLLSATSQEILKGSKLKPFKCPPKEHFVILGNECTLNGFHKDNPSDTEYQWSIADSIDIDTQDNDFGWYEDDQETYTIINDQQAGQVKVQLTLDHESLTRRTCHITVTFGNIPHLGIDLGTTYSCIAYQSSKKDPKTDTRETEIVIVDKKNRQDCIPTAIYYQPNTDNILFGKAAMDKNSTDPQNLIYDIKRIIGRNWDDTEVQLFAEKHLFRIVQDPDNINKIKIYIPNKDMYISPEQALAAIIIHLIQMATRDLGVVYNENINVVISIPAFFNNAQRRAIKSVAAIAKVNAQLLVVEPTAGAIAHNYYSLISDDDLELFMIFDFGGGTLDVSVMRCRGLACTVLGVEGDTSLGGIDFDRIITDIIINKLETECNKNINEKDYAKILFQSEEIKISLTKNDQHEYTYDSNTPEIIITKALFVEKSQPILDRAIKVVNNALSKTKKYKASNVRMILMIGGTSNIPMIKERLQYEFEKASVADIILRRNKIKLELASKPHLMVIKGTAILGGAMSNVNIDNMDDMNSKAQVGVTGASQMIRDVIPLSLGFEICQTETDCGYMSVMIPRDSTYPRSVNKSYCQLNTQQTSVTMLLYEGNSKYITNNHYLSSLTINNILPRNDKDECNTYHMSFNIDENGIATIHGVAHKSDGSDGNVYTMSLSILSKDGSLSDCEVKDMQIQMVSWFKSRNIQNLLTETACVNDDEEIEVEVEEIKNYVYLDASGSMTGDNYKIGSKLFKLIGESLINQETRIVLFGSDKKSILDWNMRGKWNVDDIIKQWNIDMGWTFMWKMILDDVTNNHLQDLDVKRARITVISDGDDNESPSPYSGLKGFMPMMREFINKKKLDIEFNFIVLSCSDWNVDEYNNLCLATSGLFFKICKDSEINQFKTKFLKKYIEKDIKKVQKRRIEQQQTYKTNVKLGKATDYDWFKPVN